MLQSFEDVCLLLNVMELDGTQVVVLKTQIKGSEQQCVSSDIVTRLLVIIY